ncbi:MAG: acetylxylan esterase [Acidobacteriota bacterium]
MKKFLPLIYIFLFSPVISAQDEDINYDESLVPDYILPEILLTGSGEKITNQSDWISKRRPEILQLFKDQVYGNIPEGKIIVTSRTISHRDRALEGKATRDEVVITLSAGEKKAELNLLIYLPVETEGPVPVFMGLNFYGNHTISPETDVQMSSAWMRNNQDFGIHDNRSHNGIRGIRESRWQVEKIISRDYGLVTLYYGDIDPDFHDGFKNGVHSLFSQDGEDRTDSSWGSISAWSWGLSRVLDYLETDKRVENRKVALIGHSRLGKTSLWAGAMDPRFALVISNDSGCGGAALSRRAYGETVKIITTSFPHWFCGKFSEYGGNESQLPVDQHMLIALMAPRPVYVASAQEDRWADPKGEFLAAKNASAVYSLFGLEGLPAQEMPEVDSPSAGTIGYHMRAGGHDVTAYDWEQYLAFADKHFRN